MQAGHLLSGSFLVHAFVLFPYQQAFQDIYCEESSCPSDETKPQTFIVSQVRGDQPGDLRGYCDAGIRCSLCNCCPHVHISWSHRVSHVRAYCARRHHLQSASGSPLTCDCSQKTLSASVYLCIMHGCRFVHPLLLINKRL